MCWAVAFMLSSAPALADEPTGGWEIGPQPPPQEQAPTATPPQQPPPPTEAPPGTWVEGATPEDDALPPPPPPPPPPADLGDTEAPTTFVVEDRAPPPSEVPMRMVSPALFGVGVGLTGLGLVATLAGGAMYVAQDKDNCIACAEKKQNAAAVVAAGIVGCGLGLTMTYLGGRQVPAPAWAKAMPTFVALGPRGGVVGWSF